MTKPEIRYLFLVKHSLTNIYRERNMDPGKGIHITITESCQLEIVTALHFHSKVMILEKK